MANIVEIIIKATDATENAFKSVGTGLSGLKDKGKALTQVGSELTRGLTLPIVGAATAITKLTMDAGELQTIKAAFDSLTDASGKSGTTMLKALQDASFGMVSNVDLMKSYNMAAQLVGETFANTLPEAMEPLGKVAAATGEDMGFMMDSLVRGVGRLSPMILDNLGIQVDLTEANKAYAETLGKSADELTKSEQQTALMNQVMEKLRENTADMPEVAGSAGQAFGELNATFRNMRDEIGTELIPVLVPVLQQVGEILKTITPYIVYMVKAFGSLPQPVQTGIIAFLGLIAVVGPLLGLVGQIFIGISALAPAFTAISGVLGTVAGIISGPVLIAIGALAAGIALLYVGWQNNWLGIQESFATVTSAIGSICQAFISLFKGDWEGFTTHLKEAWNTLWEEIKRRFEIVKTTLSNIAKSVGKFITEGLVEGVKNAASKLINAVKGVVQDALDAARSLLGLDSPSKVFAGIGEQMMAGMAVGIKGGTALPVGALASAAPQLMGAAGGGVNVNLNASVYNEVDVERMAYRVAQVIQRKQWR